jgi:hypothetical protein
MGVVMFVMGVVRRFADVLWRRLACVGLCRYFLEERWGEGFQALV